MLVYSIFILSFFSYLGGGRFYLEAVVIANPSIPAYRYTKRTSRGRFLYV